MKPHIPINHLAPFEDTHYLLSLDDLVRNMKRGDTRNFSVLGHGPYKGLRRKNVHNTCALLQEEGSTFPVVFPRSVYLTGDITLSKDKAGHCKVVIKPDDAFPHHLYETEPFLYQGRLVKFSMEGSAFGTFLKKNGRWRFDAESSNFKS